MEAIFINRSLSNKEEADILQKLSSGKKYKVYSNVETSNEIEPYVKDKFELTPEEKKKINYDIFDKVLQFGEIKINGKPITDLLMIEKASIWHYHKFRTYFYIRNLFFEIELLEKLSKTFTKVFYYTNENKLINYNFSSSGISILPITKRFSKTDKLSILNYLLFFFLRNVMSLNNDKKLKLKRHIAIDHSLKQTCLNLHTLKPEPGNYNLQYLFEKLDDTYIILEDVEIPKFSKGNKFKFSKTQIKAKSNRIFGETVLLSGILSKKVRKQTNKSVASITNNLANIKKELQNPLELLIIDHLVSLQKSNKLFLFKYFAYKLFFKKHSFRTISSIDENSPRIKTILDAAKSTNITTIGIQHGTIHDLHPAYILTNKDGDRRIHQDHTIVWGNHWANFLISKGNYPGNSIFTSGQIRTDIIPALKKVNKKDYLDIADDKKLVMFASQPQRDAVLREKAAFDVFTSVKDLDNVELVLKLHPAERGDFNYYENIAKKANCSNFRIVLDFDLYLLISISDIVITCFSTVGAETVYFDKPLIILDHLMQDIQQYHKEGIAFQTSNSIELNKIITNLLSGKTKHDKSAYQEYIRMYAHRVDGKVSDRVLKLIQSF